MLATTIRRRRNHLRRVGSIEAIVLDVFSVLAACACTASPCSPALRPFVFPIREEVLDFVADGRGRSVHNLLRDLPTTNPADDAAGTITAAATAFTTDSCTTGLTTSTRGFNHLWFNGWVSARAAATRTTATASTGTPATTATRTNIGPTFT